jgi:hypothetical protein
MIGRSDPVLRILCRLATFQLPGRGFGENLTYAVKHPSLRQRSNDHGFTLVHVRVGHGPNRQMVCKDTPGLSCHLPVTGKDMTCPGEHTATGENLKPLDCHIAKHRFRRSAFGIGDNLRADEISNQHGESDPVLFAGHQE